VEHTNGKAVFSLNNRKITSYAELYSSNLTSDKDVDDCSTPTKVLAADYDDRKSPSTSSSNDNIASSNSVSLLQDEFHSNVLSMNGTDWGNCVYNDEAISSSSILSSNDRNISDGSFTGLVDSELPDEGSKCSL
jgi:hypothetical protein